MNDPGLEAIREKYKQIRDDPMTPQYLTGQGQSGSLLDYQEAQELGDYLCRNGHQHLVPNIDKDWSMGFCTTCGHRVCDICGKDVGAMIVDARKHAQTHE